MEYIMMIRKYKELFDEVQREHQEADKLHRDSRVLLVDGMNLFIRTFSAIPTLNDDGQHIGGLVGFLKSLASTIRMVRPTRVVVVFDGKGGSLRRKKVYSNYKERRAIKSRLNRVVGFEDIVDEQASMKWQISRVYQYLQQLPITTIMIDNIEADDVIAYLSSYLPEKVFILSNDRDFLQLVSDKVNVYIPTKKKMYNPQNLLEESGIWSQNFALYKALLGDKSDNIQGIKGMGDKTILKQFPELGDKRKIVLEEFVESCKLYDGKSKSMNELKNSIGQFQTNYQIMQLEDVDIPSSTKSTIRNLVDGEIDGMSKIELDKMFVQDKLRSSFPTWEDWLQNNFSNLNSLREKYAG
jgi:DNA polymerase-1